TGRVDQITLVGGRVLVAASTGLLTFGADGNLAPLPGRHATETGSVRRITEVGGRGLVIASYGLFTLDAEGRLALRPGGDAVPTGGEGGGGWVGASFDGLFRVKKEGNSPEVGGSNKGQTGWVPWITGVGGRMLVPADTGLFTLGAEGKLVPVPGGDSKTTAS